MTKREANLTLMTHWMQAWTTLGRWQALNARLSREMTPRDFGWAQRSSASSRWHAVPAGVSELSGSGR